MWSETLELRNEAVDDSNNLPNEAIELPDKVFAVNEVVDESINLPNEAIYCTDFLIMH